MANATVPGVQDRRNYAAREALLCRVLGEFDEMPGLRLTAAQAQRLFGLRSDICGRVLTTLVQKRALTCEHGQYHGFSCVICGGR